MNKPDRYWFPAKRYGWGWGIPQTWQGWLVLAAYLLLVLLDCVLLPPAQLPLPWLIGFSLLTAAFLALCWHTGEPPRWRWGKQ